MIIEVMEDAPTPTGEIITQTSNVVFKKRENKFEAEIIMQKVHMNNASLE